MEWMDKILTNYKEKITGLIGGLLMILTGFGLTDWVAALRPVNEAIKAGDWQAAFAAFIAGVWMLLRVFRRMRDDRKG